MKTDKRSNVLRYIIGGYGLLYLAMLISEVFSPEYSEGSMVGQANLITVLFAFVVFLVGIIYSWFNELIAGILICSWHFIVWAFSLLLWPDAGMVLILIFPMLFPGVLLIRNWYMKKNKKYAAENERTRLTLLLLLINYTAIYLLIVAVNTLSKLFDWTLPTRVDDLVLWDYTSFLGLILLFLLVLFGVGALISKRSMLMAGMIFIVWYILVLFLNFSYPEFANSGPWFIFGLVILIQGIFYMVLHIFLQLGVSYFLYF